MIFQLKFRPIWLFVSGQVTQSRLYGTVASKDNKTKTDRKKKRKERNKTDRGVTIFISIDIEHWHDHPVQLIHHGGDRCIITILGKHLLVQIKNRGMY